MKPLRVLQVVGGLLLVTLIGWQMILPPTSQMICGAVTRYADAGYPNDSRGPVVSTIEEMLKNADERLVAGYPSLRNNIQAPDHKWQKTVDAFMEPCRDIGTDD